MLREIITSFERVYSDPSFAKNDDFSSQLDFIIISFDASNRAYILDYSSRDSRRVVRSISGGEIYAFPDAFGQVFVLRTDLEELYQRKTPLESGIESL